MRTALAVLAAAAAVAQGQAAQARSVSVENPIVLGYYTNWAQYRPSKWQFVPENIDPTLFTHLAYAFAQVEDKSFQILPFEANDILDDGDGGMYKRFHKHVRAKNPSIKTLISLGGWVFSQETTIFNDAASTAARRETFANNILSFVRKHGFDGVDVDWEYPLAADRENFTALMKLLRKKINAEAKATGQEPMLLSIAVSANPNRLTEGYDPPVVADQVDWIGLMTYDLHGQWDPQTRCHTQLFRLHPGDNNEMSVTRTFDAWLKVVPPEKLLMGLALYGRAFALKDASAKTAYQCNMMAEAEQPAPKGEITNESGFIAYYEILDLIANGAKTCEDTTNTYTAVVQNGTTWVGYDNKRTLGAKLAVAKSYGVRGIMFWAIDLDDFPNGSPLISYASASILGTKLPKSS